MSMLPLIGAVAIPEDNRIFSSDQRTALLDVRQRLGALSSRKREIHRRGLPRRFGLGLIESRVCPSMYSSPKRPRRFRASIDPTRIEQQSPPRISGNSPRSIRHSDGIRESVGSCGDRV